MGLFMLKNQISFSLRCFCSHVKPNIMKYLNVAEKNDAAKNIAAILSRGGSNRREGLSQYNKIYEFDGQLMNQQVKMIMTSVSGHLLNYAFVSTFKNWHSCNPVALFDAPVHKVCPEDYIKIKKTLEREIKYCQGLIIWTDCDREGENIGFEVIQVCSDVKPNLRIYRAKFSEITQQSIFRALNNLGQPNQNVSDAVNVRQELDLRTGAAFTRLQTLRLQRVFPQKLNNKVISYGSCQFPTLGFVVERYQAIENFIPERFWKIKMNHVIKDLTTDFVWKRDRLFEKNAVEAILDICKENPLATVESVDSKPKNKWRPLPLDTVEMEKNISRKLRINAKETMKIAEKLYTSGFISYPRTETNSFPKELNLAALVEQQREDNRWGPFANRIMGEFGGPNPRQGKKSDQAHPPIHPTKYANNLQGNESRVYEYIVRHFLACVSKDALGHETTVIANIADEIFTAKGLMILERNYLDVYTYEKWNAKEINQYKVGDTFTPTELEIVDSSTAPPKLLTEADLIALMEKHGIGTDATHAEHIEKIKSRDYVGMHENMYFVPGTLGMGLVEGYNNIGLEISLAKPTLRADFENDLKSICEGRKNPEDVRVEQIAKYRDVFRTVAEKIIALDQSLAHRMDDQAQIVDDIPTDTPDYKPVLKCPKCGSDMIVKERKNGAGKFLCCTGYPTCKNAVWFPAGIMDIEVLDESCRHCGPDVKKLKVKFRQNPFIGEPNPNVLCIGGCDQAVMLTLDIAKSSVQKQNPNTTTQNTSQNNMVQNRTNNVPPTNNRTTAPRNNPPNNLNNWMAGGSATTTNSSNKTIVNGILTRTNPTQNNTTNNGDSGFASANRADRSSWTNTNNAMRNNGPSLMPGLTAANNRNANAPRNQNNAFGNTNNNRPPATPTEEEEIVCHCDKPAILLTVRKEGPNTGKKFYKCSENSGGGSGGCSFFLWAPDEQAMANSSNPRQLSPTSNSSQNELKCDCYLPAAQRTVNKEGPNKGRQFFACSKPMGQGCKFFKWADEVDQNGGGGGGDDWGGGGGGGNTSWGGTNAKWSGNTRGRGGKKRPAKTNNQGAANKKTVRAKRKCGNCGDEGHTRNKCPNN